MLQVATSHTPQVASWPQWRTRVPTMISDYGLRIKYGARLESMLERVERVLLKGLSLCPSFVLGDAPTVERCP